MVGTTLRCAFTLPLPLNVGGSLPGGSWPLLAAGECLANANSPISAITTTIRAVRPMSSAPSLDPDPEPGAPPASDDDREQRQPADHQPFPSGKGEPGPRRGSWRDRELEIGGRRGAEVDTRGRRPSRASHHDVADVI